MKFISKQTVFLSLFLVTCLTFTSFKSSSNTSQNLGYAREIQVSKLGSKENNQNNIWLAQAQAWVMRQVFYAICYTCPNTQDGQAFNSKSENYLKAQEELRSSAL